MRRQSAVKALAASVDLLMGLLDKLTDKTSALATNLWEAIGDLRKNVGDLRTTVNAGIALRKSLEERLFSNETEVNALRSYAGGLRENADRAWQLAESRNAVHHKAARDLTEALQRFNERLSKLEGKSGTEVLNGSVQMLSECLVSHNERISKLEEIRGVMPLFKSSSEAGMIRALPGILRMIHSPDFVKAVETAGYKIDVDSIIELVQKVVDEREAAQEQAKPAKAVVWQQGHITSSGSQEQRKGVDLSYSQLPKRLETKS